MHLVDVCAFYSTEGGGVKTYVERKLTALPKLGHQVTLIVPGEETKVEPRGPGAQIVHLQSPAFPLDRRYRYFDDEAALHRTLDEVAPDLVEASSPWSSAAMVGRWHGSAPRALVMHADPLASYAYRWLGAIMPQPWIDRTFGSFWRHLLRMDPQYDLIVCANHSLADRLSAGGMTGIVTVPMGIDADRFSPDHRSENLRAEMLEQCGLGPDATLLLGIGRLGSEKRWPMVVEAVRAVGGRHPVGLLLIGDGPDRSTVLRHIGMDPHIRLLPRVEDRNLLARIIASGDALVHGCESETYGLVPAEARASGLPLIVPDRGGATDQYVEGAGYLYRAARADALADAIQQFINSDRLSLRRNARQASASVDRMDRHFGVLLPLYEQLIGGAKRAD